MIAYDLLQYLELLGFGTEAIDLFLGFEPDSPNNCITLFDESTTLLEESACLSIDLLGVHIIVRNENYINGKNIMDSIHKKIMGFGGSSLIDGGNIVSYITCENAPYSLGKDSKGRNQISAHYNVRVESEDNEFRL